jgi:hypothetical protein
LRCAIKAAVRDFDDDTIQSLSEQQGTVPVAGTLAVPAARMKCRAENRGRGGWGKGRSGWGEEGMNRGKVPS